MGSGLTKGIIATLDPDPLNHGMQPRRRVPGGLCHVIWRGNEQRGISSTTKIVGVSMRCCAKG